MNFDLALGLGVALFAIWGAFSGAARQLSQVLGAIAAWLIARPVGQLLGPMMAQALKSSRMTGQVLATVCCFVLVYLTVRVVANAVLKRVVAGKEGSRAGLDRALGFLLGGAKAFGLAYLAICALCFVEDNVQIGGKRLGVSPKGSAAFRLAREHNLFELNHQAQLEDIGRLLKMTGDPSQAKRLEESPEYQALKKDPRFNAILSQQAAWRRALSTGDLHSLLKDDSLIQLLDDDAAMKRVDHLAGP